MTEDYKVHLESYIDKNPKVLKDYESHYTEKDVKFVLTFCSAEIVARMFEPNNPDKEDSITKFEAEFKMTTTRPLSTTNMHLYTADGNVKKYESPEEILKDFYITRKAFYTKRKEHKIAKLSDELNYLDARIQFIEDIVNGSLNILNVPKKQIHDYLEHNGFPQHEQSYDYLTRMPIHNLTKEKKEELERECEDKKLMLSNIQKKSETSTWKEELSTLEKKLT